MWCYFCCYYCHRCCCCCAILPIICTLLRHTQNKHLKMIDLLERLHLLGSINSTIIDHSCPRHEQKTDCTRQQLVALHYASTHQTKKQTTPKLLSSAWVEMRAIYIFRDALSLKRELKWKEGEAKNDDFESQKNGCRMSWKVKIDKVEKKKKRERMKNKKKIGKWKKNDQEIETQIKRQHFFIERFTSYGWKHINHYIPQKKVKKTRNFRKRSVLLVLLFRFLSFWHLLIGRFCSTKFGYSVHTVLQHASM